MGDDIQRPERSFERLARELAEERRDAPAEPERKEYVSHAAFEEARPGELAAAEGYELLARQRWAASHESFEGYVPRREFPCPGVLRIEDETAPLWIVVCDVCGYETGVPIARLDPGRLIKDRLERSGVPPAFLGKPYESNEHVEPVLRACRDWLRRFDPKDPLPAIALFGGPGRGKTHLLALMCKVLIENHRCDVLYRSAEDLFDELKAGMDASSFEAVWQRVLNVPVLALDDLAASRMTPWKQERLQALVDHRLARELPLLIATNLPPSAWADVLGDRVESRLRTMCLRFKVDGPDRRAAGVQMEMAA